MKIFIRNLAFLAIAMLTIIGCDDDPPQDPNCVYGVEGHGVRDGLPNDIVVAVCGKDRCIGLMDYRTENMANSAHADYFQWPIHRVGTESNYGTDSEDPNTTVGNILTGYKGLNPLSELVNLKNSSPEQVHITYNAPVPVPNAIEVALGKYTWNKTILGIQKGNAENLIKQCMVLISTDTLPQQVTVALQPVGNIRMAKGRKSTEQFPVIAGGVDKDPKVNTVAQNFRLNRHAIARNNRNVKSQLAQG